MDKITTLKELKKEFPALIGTTGNIYKIDGLGRFRQRKTIFGIETYTQDLDGEWVRTSFDDLIRWMYKMYR